MRPKFCALMLALLVVGGCGGGGAPPGEAQPPSTDNPPPTPPTPPAPTNPDIAIFFVSGHVGLFDDMPSLSYLDDFWGPKIINDIEGLGYTVAAGYYVDHPTATDTGGYADLIADLRGVRDEWVFGVSSPTRVIVVAHSHGGPWATAAIRQVSNLPIRMQVALDHSSYGWRTVGHDLHDAVMGGDPRDEYIINALSSCPSDMGSWSDTSNIYDLEDVVFPNVEEALEVQSGEPVVFREPYDDKWNVRLDGTLTGLSCYWSDTTHFEVRSSSGTTYPVVANWVLSGLAGD